MNKLQVLLNKKRIFFTVIMIAIAGIAISSFFFIKYQQAQNIINNPGLAEKLEVQDLVKKVSKFISLPENELPIIATVSDYKKLEDQPFFEKSKNGDKVLIYTKARKGYLYRPSTDRLIDVTIVNVDSSSSQSPIVKSREIKIVLRNGTSSVGLTSRVEPEIKKALVNAAIIQKENAAKNDYQKTIVVVLNKNTRQAASIIADYLKSIVTSLPSDESRPVDGDILIIIGKDKIP